MENEFDDGGTRAWRANQATWRGTYRSRQADLWRATYPSRGQAKARRDAHPSRGRTDWPFGSFVASVVIFATLLRASAFLGAAFIWALLIGGVLVLAAWDALMRWIGG